MSTIEVTNLRGLASLPIEGKILCTGLSKGRQQLSASVRGNGLTVV